MKKWTKLFSLAIGIFMAIGAAVGVKQTAERVNATEESYTLTFASGSGDGTSASTSIAASTLLSAGSNYVTGNLVTAT